MTLVHSWDPTAKCPQGPGGLGARASEAASEGGGCTAPSPERGPAVSACPGVFKGELETQVAPGNPSGFPFRNSSQ